MRLFWRSVNYYQPTAVKAVIFTTVLLLTLVLPIFSPPRFANATGGITDTRADAWGTEEVSASGWLGGEGVPIYSNGPLGPAGPEPNQDNYIDNINRVSTKTGIKWQCVELVNRLYLNKGWITSRWPGNGSEMFNNTPSGLTKEANGSITYISLGDVVAMSGGPKGLGHVGIVNEVNGGAIQIASQNTGQVYSTFSLNSASLTAPSWSLYGIQGIIHHGEAPRGTETGTVPWSFEEIDGSLDALSSWDSETGKTPEAIEFNGQLYVFSYDQSNALLRYAKTTPSWEFGILDGAGGGNGRTTANVGQTPAAVVWAGTLQVFYYNAEGQNLRHAWTSNGTNWSFETLDGGVTPRGTSPTATTYGTSIQVFYGEGANGNLRHAFASTTQGWVIETLDGDTGSITGYSGDTGYDPTVVSYNGTLQVFSRDASGENLRHIWVDPGYGWRHEDFDGTTGSICHLDGDIGSNPTTLAYNNALQVFYYDASRGNLRHAWSDANGWHCETLEGDPGAILGYDHKVGLMPTAVVWGDSLQVYAYQPDWGALRHYWITSTQGWRSENLDGLGGNPSGRLNNYLGHDPVVTTLGNGLQLFYFDQTNGNLRHTAPN